MCISFYFGSTAIKTTMKIVVELIKKIWEVIKANLINPVKNLVKKHGGKIGFKISACLRIVVSKLCPKFYGDLESQPN